MAKTAVIAFSVSFAAHAAVLWGMCRFSLSVPGTAAVPRLEISRIELSDDLPVPKKPSCGRIDVEAAESALPRPGAPELPVSGRGLPVKPAAAPPPENFARPVPAKVEMLTPRARIEAPPRPVETISPRYPVSARRRGEEGTVVVDATVGADGCVVEAVAARSSGSAELDDAAVKAVRGASFVPAVSNGVPVSAHVRISLVFRLR